MNAATPLGARGRSVMSLVYIRNTLTRDMFKCLIVRLTKTFNPNLHTHLVYIRNTLTRTSTHTPVICLNVFVSVTVNFSKMAN